MVFTSTSNVFLIPSWLTRPRLSLAIARTSMGISPSSVGTMGNDVEWASFCFTPDNVAMGT